MFSSEREFGFLCSLLSLFGVLLKWYPFLSLTAIKALTLLEFVFGGEDKEDLYPQSYGHENAKNGSFFVFSDTDSKTLVTVWAKYVILHQNDVTDFFQKLVWLTDFGFTVREISRLTL